jgi:hypothetical protein
MRTIHHHDVEGAPGVLSITVLDEPGHGGACHQYEVISQDNLGPGTLYCGNCLDILHGPIDKTGGGCSAHTGG